MRLLELFEAYSNEAHGAAGTEIDGKYNREAASYSDAERKRTKAAWKNADGGVPVVLEEPEDKDAKDFTTEPSKMNIQSPGYRGREEAKERAGIPNRKYDKHDPEYIKPDIADIPKDRY